MTLVNTTNGLPKKLPRIDIEARGDRIIILPLEGERKTAAGIIIPDTAVEKPRKGVVISVGPGKDGEPMACKRGDVVCYGKYSGSEYDFVDPVSLEKTTFLIMHEHDLAANVVQPY